VRHSWNEIKAKALAFSKQWANASNEDSEAKPFWIDFLDLFGIPNKRVATFELNVAKHGGDRGYVDMFWPGVLLVEHKSRGKNLDAAFRQAQDYLAGLPDRDLPALVVVCDFARFRVHRLGEHAPGQYIEFALKDLHKHVRLFGLLGGYKVQALKPEDPVNIKAAERMGRLHDALQDAGYGGHALEVLLVRILFCLFADDTSIFSPAQAFRDFVRERTAPDGSDLGLRLAQLFQVLNTPEDARSSALDEQLAPFPYVNGRLFAETLPLADFSPAMREALLDACALDWSSISPAIFGSLFQSIMDKQARRNLGAHYTSEANILKLIQPLFLDELQADFERVRGNRNRLFEFHKKLRQLKFLDPACGCGNFLVISYRELRELELQVLRAAHELSDHKGQKSVDIHNLIGVNVDQFHGIEIEEFPAQIAQVALWLMDHQMNMRASEEFGLYFARIPLKSTPQIRHGNALRTDWNEVLVAERCHYVLGNPPFVGAKFLDDAQRADVREVFAGLDNAGLLDFVAAWYVKAARYIAHEGDIPTRCGFVSTNSITQGEQVGVLWSWMLARGVRIHFAHRTFQWSNEARGKAAVHCVIIGFGLEESERKTIFEYESLRGEAHAVVARNINPYLVDAPDLMLAKRSGPICQVPPIRFGSQPIDGGHFILTQDEAETLMSHEPNMKPYVRKYLGADEFINGESRWCLWLAECPPKVLRNSPFVLERVQKVRDFRLSSKRPATQELAQAPALFAFNSQPKSDYLLVPSVSSERRLFVPIGYLSQDVVASNLVFTVPDASLFHFGILTSTMHNAWMRAVCGRLESRYRYSASIVYNNFPWPGFVGDKLSEEIRSAIEAAAQGVLDARALFPGASLADLYDPLAMPPELLKAHQRLDAAVDRTYLGSGGKRNYRNDAERAAFLFDLYQRLTSLLPASAPKSGGRKRTPHQPGTVPGRAG
jgi:hypothetical protein